MGYLSSARGDYLGGYRGDPGLFGFLGKVAKGALGIAGSILPGPLGAVARFGSRIFAPSQAPVLRGPGPPGVARFTGPRVQIGRFTAAGPSLSFGGVGGRGPPGLPGFGRKRRRMNPGNVRALRRAMRRQESFVKLARRALKGSKYAITTRGSRPAARHVHVTESGPGGVTVGR